MAEMPEMPEAYRGREQTWLKHRVLLAYLQAWSHKISSGTAQPQLWYVDVFAGPWESQAQDRQDTSVAIGLKVLNDAARDWAQRGKEIGLHAIFVEKHAPTFRELELFVASEKGAVDAHTYCGAFADLAPEVHRQIGHHAAFVFVDPTGWKGAALQHIALLAGHFGDSGRPARDVMVNVMYDHLNRFKDDRRGFLRAQFRDFFGAAEDLPLGLSEDALMETYRDRLGRAAGVPFVADLAVPVPTKERTNFRLVVAGHHPKVIELFRDVEAKVIGSEAAGVRHEAKLRATDGLPQQRLFRPPAPELDAQFAAEQAQATRDVRTHLIACLDASKALPFAELWPPILCRFHLTLARLRRIVLELEREQVLEVRGRTRGERTVKDAHLLALCPSLAQPR